MQSNYVSMQIDYIGPYNLSDTCTSSSSETIIIDSITIPGTMTNNE